jgi:hypothetical protein
MAVNAKNRVQSWAKWPLEKCVKTGTDLILIARISGRRKRRGKLGLMFRFGEFKLAWDESFKRDWRGEFMLVFIAAEFILASVTDRAEPQFQIDY